jgi:hypothetical protein
MHAHKASCYLPPIGGRMPGCGAAAGSGPPGGRIMGGACTWGRGAIMPGAGAPTPRPGPARPYGSQGGAAGAARQCQVSERCITAQQVWTHAICSVVPCAARQVCQCATVVCNVCRRMSVVACIMACNMGAECVWHTPTKTLTAGAWPGTPTGRPLPAALPTPGPACTVAAVQHRLTSVTY